MARASVFEKPRFGNESTPGDNVAADKVLQSFETFVATPKIPRTAVRAAGTLAASGVFGAKDHTEWSGDGILAYNDITHMLAGALCKPTSATVVSGVSELTYRPVRDNPNSIQTFTVQGGSTAGSYEFCHAFVNDLSFSFDRNSAKFSVSGMGGQFNESITLTASPTNVPQVSVEPDSVNVYVASTYATLTDAGSKLLNCYSANFAVSGRQTPVFTLDSDVGSYSATVERKETSFGGSITVGQDSQGAAILNRMRLKDVFFIRFEATGRDIVSGQPYRFQHTCPCFVNETQRSDSDDLYTGQYDFTCCYLDNAFGTGVHGFVETKVRVPSAEATRTTGVASNTVKLPELIENATIG